MTDPPLATLAAAHRDYLRRVAGVRFDDRLRGRLDESDLVQEALAEAARRPPPDALPPRLWLRQLLLDALLAAQRRHLVADRRAVGREVELSASGLAGGAERLFAAGPSPSSAAGQAERTELVRQALAALDPADREVITLRAFEQLSAADTAAVLGLSPEAASKRFVRALDRLRRHLPAGGDP